MARLSMASLLSPDPGYYIWIDVILHLPHTGKIRHLKISHTRRECVRRNTLSYARPPFSLALYILSCTTQCSP